jgi:hypothetical protein
VCEVWDDALFAGRSLVFPAFFARLLQGMRQHHPDHDSSLDNAKWIILGLDASEAYAHHKELVIQSIFVSMSIMILGVAAFCFF